ncbi:TPA: molecular chaperone [Pseudomonas aeruginosa]|nr:molecular chaperone [Pseudomonas aeruginosa]HBP0451110.1 molecular chaperone [Pseudomonas aeruginosa]HBP0586920.1 molecular chaperone [Pseudomonas aeruginosa]
MKYPFSSRVIWGGILLLFSTLANAGITLGGTRVVLQAPAKEAAILVRNQASKDVMIQSWVEADNGADKREVPFVITPTLSRLGGNKQQTLRILFQGEGLPSDRESVFRLNVQEIPQKSASANTLQIALRQRIKVFYRPDNLSGTSAEAPGKLNWRLVRQGGKSVVEVSNDTAFHVSLASVKLKAGNAYYVVDADMVAPKSSRRFEIKGTPSGVSGNVEFQSVNDYGGLDKHSSSLSD